MAVVGMPAVAQGGCFISWVSSVSCITRQCRSFVAISCSESILVRVTGLHGCVYGVLTRVGGRGRVVRRAKAGPAHRHRLATSHIRGQPDRACDRPGFLPTLEGAPTCAGSRSENAKPSMSIFGTAAKPAAPADVEVSQPHPQPHPPSAHLRANSPDLPPPHLRARLAHTVLLNSLDLLCSCKTSSLILSAACRGLRLRTSSPWEAGTTKFASSR